MSILIWILLATLLNSLLGLVGIFSFWIKEKLLNRLVMSLVAFSAGTLLGGAFFHLLAESVESLPAMNVFGYALIGFIFFLLIEGYFHWHHCKNCAAHPFTKLMLVGSGIHNFIDGLIIAAAFQVNILLGVISTAMILAHELPQELGLFGVLIYGKYKKKKALWYAFSVQAICIVGGVVGFLVLSKVEVLSSFLIPFAAGGFIYIAAADLIPEMHKMYQGKVKETIKMLSVFLLGILFMLGLKLMFG
ncbi:ZIP family metal transporter [Candidatus Woesearchaeota archaeon]|nr:ZIP family metal transporter [Candidatus Woesearchaeota archaeon]